MSDALHLVELIATRDRRALADAVWAMAREDGIDAAVKALCVVQEDVGRRWQLHRWTVADEHAATALVDFALASATTDLPVPTSPLGTIAVLCAEEEWHVLPARMLAELLRARGWEITFLGPSIPAEHLEPYLARHRPHVVALSCSVPMHLPGARRSIAAAHRAGRPVVVGGHGFGPDSHRAMTLGADAWAPDAREAHAKLLAWTDQPPALTEPHDDGTYRALAADHAAVAEAAFTDLAGRFPPMAHYNAWQLAKTREDLDYMLRFTEAAVLTGDERIVCDFVRWLIPLLTTRGVPAVAATAGLQSLLRSVSDRHDRARSLLNRAIATAEDEA